MIKKLVGLLVLALFSSTALAQTTSSSQIEVKIEGMTCSSCTGSIERAFKKMEQIKNITVNLKTKLATIYTKPEKEITDTEIRKIISDLDYQVIDIKRESK